MGVEKLKVRTTYINRPLIVQLVYTRYGTMKVVLVALFLFGVAAARPQFPNPASRIASILRFDNFLDQDRYNYNVETSDGFKKQESGVIENAGTDQESLAVTGSYSYVGDDGQTYEVKYTAGENGFEPEGEHIPQSAGVKPKLGIPSAALASLSG